MNWTLRLGKFFGIALYIHWTFALLLVFVFWSAGGFRSGGASIRDAIELVGFVVSVFACVTLHEYGHALAARYFGIRTRDITILPFGGLARLEIKRYRAIEEFVIAVAGPAVNVVIAGVLVGVLVGLYGAQSLTGMTFRSGFFEKLLLANITLVIFNMIPAFPMDGGRVLRSILAAVFGLSTGTLVAARVGQGLAVLFIAAAFSPIGTPMLAVVGVFVFLGAQAELRGVRARVAFERVVVRDVMSTSYGVLLPEDPVGAAIEAIRTGSQPVIPIVEAGALMGVVGPRELQAAVDRGDVQMPVRGVVRTRLPIVLEDSTGSEAVDRMQESQLAALPVMRGQQMVGLVTFQAIQRAASSPEQG
ncbi:MAG: site-2 protease family protein [Phycisphaerales bacterium]|nr:site-2 protease family protein [Phycisphaerales bacterium]